MSESRDRRTRIAGSRCRFVEAGAGPPLVLLHGLGIGAVEWRAHVPPLAAAGFRVIAPDLPCFGETAGPRMGMSVEELAEWLAAFARGLDLGPAAWLGHSITCQAAVELAVQEPTLARALVLVSPTGTPARFPRTRQLLMLLRDAPREPWPLVRLVVERYLRTPKLHILGTWYKAARHRPLRRIGSVRCPVLLVGGDEDPIVPTEYLELMAAHARAARVAVFEGAHGVALSRPDALIREVLAFLQSDASAPDRAATVDGREGRR